MSAFAHTLGFPGLGMGQATPSPQPAAAEVGGKAQGLQRLQAAGYRVPAFRVVVASSFSRALAEAGSRLRAILAAGPVADAPGFEAATRAIDALLSEPAVAARLRLAVERSLSGVLAARRRYAVRSSAVGEDSEAASFAGQLDTRLNVPAQQVVDAVVAVWGSAFSARALAYRGRLGPAAGDPAAAVIVQEMVPADAAGVLFTRGPEQPGDCVICAGYGLGEGIVNDRVAVDTYRIKRSSGAIARQIANKPTRVGPAVAGGTLIESVDPAARSRAVLTDRILRRLCALGLRLESQLGMPLDIEFALDPRQRIYLLQARPITAAARSAGAVRVWDNANIVESYPGLTLPLTFSFAQAGYAAAFRDYMRRRTIDFPPFHSPLRTRDELFHNLIGLVDGRVYYNLLSWYEMMSPLPGFTRMRASWDRMIGITGSAASREHRLAWAPRMIAWAYCACKLLRVRSTVERFTQRFAAVYARFAPTEFTALSADELVDCYQGLKSAIATDWSLTLDTDFAAMAYFEALHVLCRRWGDANAAQLANSLLRHAPDMESVRPVRVLKELVGRVRGDARLRALFAQQDDERILAEIRANEEHREFARALHAYLDRYGDRGIEELKLEQETFRERPTLLIATLRTLLGSPRDPMEGSRQQLSTGTPKRLRAPHRRLLLAWVLGRARFALASRENMRFARTRVFGIARSIFRALGRRLAEEGLLERAEDIHYLTTNEVFACVRGTGVTRDLAALVALRRREYAEYSRRQPSSRLCTQGIPSRSEQSPGQRSVADGPLMRGTPCAAGNARAPARIVRDPRLAAPVGRHILVAESTDPGWVFLMTRADGLVVERGSVLSHTAIIGRELGIPTVVGVEGATGRIPDGALVSIDGTTGVIQWR